MMESQVDRELLEKIADLVGKPIGAFNIRKDSGCDGRQPAFCGIRVRIGALTNGGSNGCDTDRKDAKRGKQQRQRSRNDDERRDRQRVTGGLHRGEPRCVLRCHGDQEEGHANTHQAGEGERGRNKLGHH